VQRIFAIKTLVPAITDLKHLTGNPAGIVITQFKYGQQSLLQSDSRNAVSRKAQYTIVLDAVWIVPLRVGNIQSFNYFHRFWSKFLKKKVRA
jgi:hypothetical protein